MNRTGATEFFAPIINELSWLFISIVAVAVAMLIFVKNKSGDQDLKDSDKYITWIFIGHYLFLALWQLYYVINIANNKPIETIFSLIIIAILIVIGIKSFVIIRPDQMGLRITLGETGDHLGSGPNIAIAPIQEIVKVPTNLQSIAFATNSVMTKRGRVTGYSDIIESAEISVLFTVFYVFDQKKLASTIKAVSGFTETDLAEELVPYARDVLRTLIGRTPWRLINEERFKFTQCALGRIFPLDKEKKARNFRIKKTPLDKKGKIIQEKEDADIFLYDFEEIKEDDNDWLNEKQLANSPFVQFGLDKISIVIEDIDFTDDKLKAAVSAPELARLTKDAERLNADAERYTIEQKGEAEATARKAMLNVLKENIDLETLSTLQKMAQGESNTFFLQLPSKLRNALSDDGLGDLSKLFNPNNIESLVKSLKPEQLDVLTRAIKGIKKT